MNNVVLIGRLVRDVELKSTQGGKTFAIFTLAIDRDMSKEKKQEAEAKGYATADFVSCKAWEKQAEILSRYISKGQKVAIVGSIETSNYTDNEGKQRNSTLVLVRNIEFVEKSNGTNNQSSSMSQGYVPMDDDIPF